MSFIPSHKHGTKIRLLDTAEQVFAEYGYEGTSTRRIAHAAGLNLSLINYYFGSKEALYQEVFRQKLSDLHARLLHITSRADKAPDKLTQFINIYIDGYGTNCSFQRLLYREVTFLSGSAIKEIITEHLTENFKILRSIIDDGVSNGFFKVHDASLFYLTVFSLLPMSVCGSPLVAIVNHHDQSAGKSLSREKLENYLLTLLQADTK